MTFSEYMKTKQRYDRYNSSIAPFMQKIDSLKSQREAEKRAIDNSYDILINEELAVMEATCEPKPFEWNHDIPVIMEVHGGYGDYSDTEIRCYCLTCGVQLNPSNLNTTYIYLKRVISVSEIPLVLAAMKKKLDEMYKEKPEMDMQEVKSTLAKYIHAELYSEQRKANSEILIELSVNKGNGYISEFYLLNSGDYVVDFWNYPQMIINIGQVEEEQIPMYMSILKDELKRIYQDNSSISMSEVIEYLTDFSYNLKNNR